MIKYLLDENVDPRLRTALETACPGLTVWKVGDPATPTRGTLDPEILVWCQEHRFVLVTNNRRSMPAHLVEHLKAGDTVPGIFILNPMMTFGETADELALIHEVCAEDEFANRISYLPLST